MIPTFSKVARSNVRLLALDPGHTTGWAIFENRLLLNCGQIDTTIQTLTDLITKQRPQAIVCEEYRIYKGKASQHVNSTVPTIQIIGVIQTLAFQQQLPIFFQKASDAKFFATDAKLTAWGFKQRALNHANDAIRHGVYFLAFGGPR